MLSPEVLSRQLEQDGFLAVDDVIPRDELDRARALLDGLFNRLASLPSALVRELGDPSSGMQIPEINRPTRMLKELRRSPVLERCRSLARNLSRGRARYVFDHAIYKLPGEKSETPWHQDVAFDPASGAPRELHFWIPLQDVTPANGCMRFVRGSHRLALLAHHAPDDNHASHALEAAIDPASLGTVVESPIKAGGVTIHYATTLHGSTSNTTSEVRKAWIIHFNAWGRLGKFWPTNLVRRVIGGS